MGSKGSASVQSEGRLFKRGELLKPHGPPCEVGSSLSIEARVNDGVVVERAPKAERSRG